MLRHWSSRGHCRLSAASYLEAAIVIDGSRDPVLSRRLMSSWPRLASSSNPSPSVRPASPARRIAISARAAAIPAQLNFGDCFAYALAKDKAEPLLFKGGDFAHTDVRRAI